MVWDGLGGVGAGGFWSGAVRDKKKDVPKAAFRDAVQEGMTGLHDIPYRE